MAAIFAYEIPLEAIRIVRQPDFTLPRKIRIWKPVKNGWVRQTTLSSENAVLNLWTGLLPGLLPSLAQPPTPEIAKMIVEDYQKRNLLHLLRGQSQRDLCY
ncbi:MAG: hypothetical protein R2860_16390 [Desulfobacterales bacterium]